MLAPWHLGEWHLLTRVFKLYSRRSAQPLAYPSCNWEPGYFGRPLKGCLFIRAQSKFERLCLSHLSTSVNDVCTLNVGTNASYLLTCGSRVGTNCPRYIGANT